jgi:Undecaprenyl-phosphate glucose phosphotransferase
MSVTPLAGQHLKAAPLQLGFVRRAFAVLCVAVEGAAILATALVSSVLWQASPLAQPSSTTTQLRLGLSAVLLVSFFTLLRNEYRVGLYVAGENTLRRTVAVWNMAFFLLFVMAFATRQTEELSRGAVILFYVTGCGALWGVRRLLTRALRIASKLRLILAQRILVVGTEAAMAAFGRRHQPWNHGFEIVGSVAIRPASAPDGLADLRADLHRAVEIARVTAVDDVYVALPWSETDTIECCVEAFLNTPVAIHLAPERILDRFDRATIGRVGAMASLELTRPMSNVAVCAKRSFDITVACLTLVLLSPLFAVVALLIKLDSPGPVFFKQTRYGFNQRPFRILKFRTMTTFADGGEVPQATPGDPRVTRIGRHLRRTNIDELPQLFNVVMGQMSLVGPRPHAVPHNRAYERRIDLYARRHNVKPGITGWAQVNGLRGETDTEEKMRRRVEHDLYYIDNWSMPLDLRILALTVLSPKAYRNAL